jgi:hypothetical protein
MPLVDPSASAWLTASSTRPENQMNDILHFEHSFTSKSPTEKWCHWQRDGFFRITHVRLLQSINTEPDQEHDVCETLSGSQEDLNQLLQDGADVSTQRIA